MLLFFPLPYHTISFIAIVTFLFQISQHRQETLSTLPFNNNIKEVFSNIKATSNTEVTPPCTLAKVPMLWRSEEFTLFAQRLDNIFIQKKTSTKGRQYVMDFVHKARRITPISSHAVGFKDVPRNLPRNCYNTKYLSTLLETQLVILNPTNPIPMTELLQAA